MPRLIAAIVRHGDYQQLAATPSAHQPFPLNSRGLEQAEQGAITLHKQLQQQQLQLDPELDCSTLLRSWQTAQVIQQTLDRASPHRMTRVCQFDALTERCVGSAANLSVQQIEALIEQDPRYPALPEDWKADSHFCLPRPGAESLLQAGERVAKHLQTRMQTLATCATEDTLKLFVGHGAAFRHAAYHLGVISLPEVRGLSMYHAHPVLLEYHAERPWRQIGGDSENPSRQI